MSRLYSITGATSWVSLALLTTACAPGLLGSIDSSNAQLSISVALKGLSYTSDAVASPQGTAITPITPSFAQGSATSWSISPALPSGLSISSSTGIISGTPTTTTPGAATSTFTTYTVTATNLAGSTTYPVKILVPASGISVTSTSWTADASPNNGVCEGPCTLRAAMDTLNGTGSSAQTFILLGAGTYTVSSTLQITKTTLTNVVICGVDQATTILDGASARQIFAVYTGGSALHLTFCNLTMQNGYTAANFTGAAVDYEQTVDGGSLTLSNVIVKNSTAASSGASTGSAVYVGNGGSPTNTTLNIERTSFVSNASYSVGGAVTVYSAGGKNITTNISNSYFSSNSVTNASGAAIQGDRTILTVSNSTFANNTASSSGGAINFQNNNTFTITNSTFFGNSATGNGGAINVNFATVTGNIRLSSFVNNTATAASGGGAIATSGGTVTVTSTGNLFSGNTANGSAHHCLNTSSTISNGGYNAFSSAGSSCGSVSGNDRSAASLGVASALGLNGGEVMNISLNSGSTAIDLVPNATCSGFASVDTRGYSRSASNLCDAGAYESN